MPTTNFVAEAWSYIAIGLSFIILRLYFKISQGGLRKLAWDDTLMVCAALCYAGETSAALILGLWGGLANNNMTVEQRANLDPHSDEYALRVNGSKMNIVGWFTYTTLFWLLKCCWTVYYSRMTDGVHKMDIRIKLSWIFIGTTYIAAVCVICFKCRPFEKQWQINPNPGNACQPAFSKLQVSFIMAINTATDLWLMAIPIPIIWKARLDFKRKISLLLLFSGGWLVIIFSIIRCVTLVTVGEFQTSESGPWSVRESFVAVLVSNAPVVFPLLKRWFESITGIASTVKSSKGDSYQLSSQPNQFVSGSRITKDKKKKYQHPLSIPRTTQAWGSDEEVVTLDQGVMGTGGRGGVRMEKNGSGSGKYGRPNGREGRDGASTTTVGDKSENLEMVTEESLPGPPSTKASFS